MARGLDRAVVVLLLYSMGSGEFLSMQSMQGVVDLTLAKPFSPADLAKGIELAEKRPAVRLGLTLRHKTPPRVLVVDGDALERVSAVREGPGCVVILPMPVPA